MLTPLDPTAHQVNLRMIGLLVCALSLPAAAQVQSCAVAKEIAPGAREGIDALRKSDPLIGALLSGCQETALSGSPSGEFEYRGDCNMQIGHLGPCDHFELSIFAEMQGGNAVASSITLDPRCERAPE